MFFAAEAAAGSVLGTVADVMTALNSTASILTNPVVIPFVALGFVAACASTWKKVVPVKKK